MMTQGFSAKSGLRMCSACHSAAWQHSLPIRASAKANLTGPGHRRLSSLCPASPLHRNAASCRSAGVCAATSGTGENSFGQQLQVVSSTVANLFPLWLIFAAMLALWKPELFLWFQKDYVTAGLAITMLSMGTSLTLEDFTGVMKVPGQVALGTALQYTVMPTMGFLVSRLAGLSSPLAVGLCLVASCPGGVASNVVTFLAKADVPLSVLMTSVSTMAAVVTTPLLVKLLVGSIVPVNAAALVFSTIQVVLLPVGLGAFLNQTFPSQMEKTAPFAPLLAVSMTVLICASVLAQNAAAVKQASLKLLAAVFTLHAGGFAFGYLLAKLVGTQERQARTMSIEVGMQNSTLGAVLAAVHFKDPTTAVPCAISACMHSLLGSALAAYFRSRTPPNGLNERPLKSQSLA